jgi:Ca2+-binding EF-hand superfamily protein
MSFSVSSGAGQAAQVQQWRARQFARADQDKSGGLSLDEFTQMAARRRGGPAANSAGNPADSTQATTGTQANAAIQDGFKRLDSNNDGSLSQAELEAARPDPSPSHRPDAFNSESFQALLATQGGDQGQANQQVSQAGRGRHHHHHHGGQADQGGTRPDTADADRTSDPATLRRLAAYQAQQPISAAGSTPTHMNRMMA